MIPEGILSTLTHLQWLELPTYGGRAKLRGEEIVSLEKLETFNWRFYNIKDFDRCLNPWAESSPRNYLLLVVECSLTEVNGLGKEKVVHITKCNDLVTLRQLESLRKTIDFRTCIVEICGRIMHIFCSSCYNLPSFQHQQQRPSTPN